LPSGHLEAGESAASALIGEAKEESGAGIAAADMEFAHVMHNSSGGGRVTFFFAVQHWEGTAWQGGHGVGRRQPDAGAISASGRTPRRVAPTDRLPRRWARLASSGYLDAMIEMQGLPKRYGDRVAVDDLSFTIRPGHVTGFLGPNGAGKTTPVRILATLLLLRPLAGRRRLPGSTWPASRARSAGCSG
jgi:ABC-type multidrug transport system fused ATPase/permease subunit